MSQDNSHVSHNNIQSQQSQGFEHSSDLPDFAVHLPPVSARISNIPKVRLLWWSNYHIQSTSLPSVNS